MATTKIRKVRLKRIRTRSKTRRTEAPIRARNVAQKQDRRSN